jgi:alpha-methylacyl-CoA racemase
MVDGVASLMAPTFEMLAKGFWVDRREANLLDGGAPFYTTYATADGRYMAVGALEPGFYDALVGGLELVPGDLPDRFERVRWPELRTIFAERFAKKTREEWSSHFAGTDACVTPVLSLDEVASHEHHTGRGTFVKVGGRPVPAPAPRFSSSALEPRTDLAAAPATAAVLEAAGISASRVAAAIEAGIVD